jgi:hypothetical protein
LPLPTLAIVGKLISVLLPGVVVIVTATVSPAAHGSPDLCWLNRGSSSLAVLVPMAVTLSAALMLALIGQLHSTGVAHATLRRHAVGLVSFILLLLAAGLLINHPSRGTRIFFTIMAPAHAVLALVLHVFLRPDIASRFLKQPSQAIVDVPTISHAAPLHASKRYRKLEKT